jgi:hypothetical protein
VLVLLLEASASRDYDYEHHFIEHEHGGKNMRQDWEIVSDEMSEILRRKTDSQRLRSVDAFWRSARTILKAAIRTEHPEWDEREVNFEVARRISNGAIDFVDA